MLVVKEASNWAFWTMIASAVSAIAAVGTIGVAMHALNSWHKQEALKVQVNFKHAILDLKDALVAMPQRWSYLDINVARNLINQYPDISHQTLDRTSIFFKKMSLCLHMIRLLNVGLCVMGSSKIKKLMSYGRHFQANVKPI
ncbi:MAG: hypothetical protein RSG77_25480 [Hafnia sp.]